MEAMDKEINDRFNVWWETEGAEKLQDHYAYNYDTIVLVKSMCRTAWMNGSYVRETEIIKERLNES